MLREFILLTIDRHPELNMIIENYPAVEHVHVQVSVAGITDLDPTRVNVNTVWCFCRKIPYLVSDRVPRVLFG